MIDDCSSEDGMVLTDDYAPGEGLLNALVGRDFVVG